MHTTGEGITEQAIKLGAEPFSYVVGFYSNPASARYWAHYVVGWEGQVAKISSEEDSVPHLGVDKDHKPLLASTKWEDNPPGKVAATKWKRTVDRWHARWPQHRWPLDLTAGLLPNSCLIGVEMVAGANDHLPPAKCLRWFAKQQYDALGGLIGEIASRRGWSRDELLASGAGGAPVRLLCHEDSNPLTRADQPSGGWDPGVLRDEPRFDWPALLARV